MKHIILFTCLSLMIHMGFGQCLYVQIDDPYPFGVCATTGGVRNYLANTVPAGPGYTYTWSIGNGTIISGQGTSSVMVDWNPGTSGTISVVVSPGPVGSNGCTDYYSPPFFPPGASLTIDEIPPGPNYCQTRIQDFKNVFHYSTGTSVTQIIYPWEVQGGTILNQSVSHHPSLNIDTFKVRVRWNTGETGFIAKGVAYTGEMCPFYDTVWVNLPPHAQISGPASSLIHATQVYTVPNEAGKTWTWSAVGGSITSANNGRSVNVQWGNNPQLPTYVTVEVSNGLCTDTDTFHVNLFGTAAATLDLGPSQLLCPGSQLNLDAGIGFVSYLWSTGATGQQLIVDSAGVYSVLVQDTNGNTATDSVTIIGAIPSQLDLGQDTAFCPGNSVVLKPDILVFNPIWNTGSTADSLLVSSAGTYSLVAQDAQGCTVTDQIIISLLPPVAISIGPDTSLCTGGAITLTPNIAVSNPVWSTGAMTDSLMVSAAGTYTLTGKDAQGCAVVGQVAITVQQEVSLSSNCGVDSAVLITQPAFASYSWSTNETTPHIVVQDSGTYQVTVTDSIGCVSVASITVDLNTPIFSHPSDTICIGAGETFQPGAAPNLFFFNWTDGVNTGPRTFNASGWYYLTAQTLLSCTVLDSIYVRLNPSSASIPVPGVNNICPGDSITLDAGPGFSAYLWSDGSTSNTFSTNQGGNYSIQVWDDLGCTFTQPFDVIIQDTTLLLGPSPLQCLPQNDFMPFDLDAGSGFVSYQWSTGNNQQIQSITQAGVYSVSTVDAFGCQATGSYELVLTPALAEVQDICIGNTLQLDLNDNSGSTYLWSDGSTGSMFMTSMAGNYSVQISHPAGCIVQDSFAVVVHDPMVQVAPNPLECVPQNDFSSITLDAGAGFASYLWSDGSSQQSLTIGQAGNYSVVATDPYGCQASDSFQLVLTPGLAEAQNICIGNTLQLDLNDNSGSTYLWSDGSTTSMFMTSMAGNYSVEISHPAGCVVQDSFSVVVHDPMVQFAPNPLECVPQNDFASLNLDAGPGFATYQWSNGSNLQSLNIIQAGAYWVEVTDPYGCQTSDTFQLVLTPPLAEMQSICMGDTLHIDLNDNSGATYLWSDGTVGSVFMTNMAGNYGVEISHPAGCVVQDSFTVNINPNPQFSLAPDSLICINQDDFVPFDLGAGPGFASYQWSNGSSLQTYLVQGAGLYSVTVTDNQGCQATEGVRVVLTTINYDVGFTDEICVGEPLLLDGGNGFAAYQWSTGDTTQQITIDDGGIYQITAFDQFGCMFEDTFDIVAKPTPMVNLGPDQTFCQGSAVTLDAGINGVSYLWTPGNATSKLLIATNAGEYILEATNPNGCSDRDSIMLTEITTPVADFTFNQDSAFTYTFTHNNPTATSFTWDFGDSTAFSNGPNPTHTYTQAGNYMVTLIVANDCGADTISMQLNSVAIEADWLTDLQIYPNPTAEILVVEGELLKGKWLELELIDARGRLVLQREAELRLGVFKQQLDVRQLAEGIYMLRVGDGESTVWQRIVKN